MSANRFDWRTYGPVDIVRHGSYCALEVTLSLPGSRFVTLAFDTKRAAFEFELWSAGAKFWPLTWRLKFGRRI